MDRTGADARPEHPGERRNSMEDFTLPSRRDAVRTLVAALEARRGPVVLTGQPGVGKSWVAARAREALPACWRWASIDLGPAIDEAGLHRLILHALGSGAPADPSSARASLSEILAEGADDGVCWGLLAEDAHNASPAVLEELRILAGRMGEPTALGGLILIGSTSLARRLGTRELAALQARIAARVHLRPLDVDEFRAWLDRLETGRAWSPLAAEWLHREAQGNPRKAMLAAVRPAAPAATPPLPQPPKIEAAPSAPAVRPAMPRPAAPAWEAPPIATTKPPLQIGDGMIEVGWEPTAEPDMGHEPEPEPSHQPAIAAIGEPAATAVSLPSEQVIDDHYAALQAWTEWAQNQGREPIGATTTEGRAASSPESDGEPTDELPARVPGHPDVWAEGHQEFAPYSQLFSRLRQPRDRG